MLGNILLPWKWVISGQWCRRENCIWVTIKLSDCCICVTESQEVGLSNVKFYFSSEDVHPSTFNNFKHLCLKFQFLKVWKNTTSVVFLRMVSFPALIDSLALRDMRWESNFFVVPHNWNTLECNDWTYISLTSANSKYYLTRLYYFFFPDGDIISFIFQLEKLRQRVTQLEVDQPPYAEGDPICTNVRTDRPFEGRKYVIFFGESPHFLAGCSEFKWSEASPR